MKRIGMGVARKVVQYTLDGEYLREFESIKEAEKKYGEGISSCCRFKRTSAGGYRWLYASDAPNAEEIFKNRPITQNRYYTEEDIIQEAKKYKYLKEFREQSNKVYQVAYKRNMLDKLGLERKPDPFKYNLYSVYAYIFKETHSIYIGVTDNKERRDCQHRCFDKSSAVYKHAKENNLEIPKPTYLKEGLKPYDALDYEYKYVEQYRKKEWNVLNKAKTGRYCGSIGKVRTISNKKIMDAAKECEYLGEFEIKHRNLYHRALERGILHDLGLKQKKLSNGTYTEEYCYNIARQYRTKNELERDYPGLTTKAYSHGWYQEYWWLSDGHNRPILSCEGYKIRIYKNIKRAYEKCLGCEHPISITELKRRGKKRGIGFMELNESGVEWRIPEFSERYA